MMACPSENASHGRWHLGRAIFPREIICVFLGRIVASAMMNEMWNFAGTLKIFKMMFYYMKSEV